MRQLQPNVAPGNTWIGLGSNLGDGPLQIRRALEFLDQNSRINILRVSPLYTSAPWGETNQPDFTNAVTEISVEMDPLSLLEQLKAIEHEMGRVKSDSRWGGALSIWISFCWTAESSFGAA